MAEGSILWATVVACPLWDSLGCSEIHNWTFVPDAQVRGNGGWFRVPEQEIRCCRKRQR